MSDERVTFAAGDRLYELIEDWARLPETVAWTDVCAVSIGPGDRVHVLCRGAAPLLIFEANGSLSSVPDPSPFIAPHGSHVGPDGTWLITDEGSHALIVVDRGGAETMRIRADGPSDTGHVRSQDIHASVASVRRAAGPFNRPTGVAVAPSGDIYVADGYGNARVHRFNSAGDLIQSWGEPGTGPGQFRLPHGIHIDRRNRVCVADWGNDRLQFFDLEGGYLGAAPGFEGPAGLAMDDEGFVFVAEEEWRVSVLGPDGTVIARWDSRTQPEGARSFVAPHSIAIDSMGSLYVGEVAHAYRGIARGGRALQKLVRVA